MFTANGHSSPPPALNGDTNNTRNALPSPPHHQMSQSQPPPQLQPPHVTLHQPHSSYVPHSYNNGVTYAQSPHVAPYYHPNIQHPNHAHMMPHQQPMLIASQLNGVPVAAVNGMNGHHISPPPHSLTPTSPQLPMQISALNGLSIHPQQNMMVPFTFNQAQSQHSPTNMNGVMHMNSPLHALPLQPIMLQAAQPQSILPHQLASPSSMSSPINHQHLPATIAVSPSTDPAVTSANISRLLRDAETLRSRHQYKEAIGLYNSILYLDPQNTSVLNFKGTCHKQLKDNVGAMECYQRALSICPTDWCAHNNLGIIFKESELFEKAIEHYRLAITYAPNQTVARENMAVVLTDFGTRLKLAGSTDKAVQSYIEALEYHNAYWPAYFNLGVVFSERGLLDQALQYYQLAVERNPNYVEALCNIGVIYKNTAQLALAVDYYERALRANPNFSIAANNLAIALTDLGTQVKNEGRLEDGVQHYKRALHHNSKYPAAWYNLGVAYAERGRQDDAKLCYELAVLFDPQCAEAYNNLGVIYKDRGNLDQAIHYYTDALRANPRFSQTLNNLGVIYTMLGKLDEAFDFCSRAIKANPLYAEAHNNLGVLYRDEGRIEEAITAYQDCLTIDPSSRNAGQNRLLAMNSLPLSAQLMENVWQAHQQWGQQFVRQFEKDRYHTYENPLTAGRLLRIGYISADFFTHSVSYFIEAPLAFADATRTHVTCYSNVGRKDKKTALLQTYAHAWRTVHDKTAREVAEMIRKDQIDILIELTGHTAGNRLDVMALKPAPVQMTWIGYPNTTGLPTIDYRITDDIVDPPHSNQQYSESLIRLPGPFLCYTPPADAPPVADTPALQRGFVTFGSFNNLAKVNQNVLSCWAAILLAVPNSRVLMKCKPFASPSVCTKMLRKFADLGIEADRIELISLLPTTAEHLDTYAQVDIAIDTWPYSGTTTTCEALFMGVPVVTYQRTDLPNHAHNVGGSLLSRMELTRPLIVDSEHRYVETAIALAKDINALQNLRKQLRPAMLASTLCDGRKFTLQLENVFHACWKRHVEQQQSLPQQQQQSAQIPAVPPQSSSPAPTIVQTLKDERKQ